MVCISNKIHCRRIQNKIVFFFAAQYKFLYHELKKPLKSNKFYQIVTVLVTGVGFKKDVIKKTYNKRINKNGTIHEKRKIYYDTSCCWSMGEESERWG
jgi:hypothetical protein